MADTPLAASPAHSPLVILADGEATTTSLAVAEFFGKQHRHVLRDIRRRFDGTLALNSAVLRPGSISVGDPAEVIERPTDGRTA